MLALPHGAIGLGEIVINIFNFLFYFHPIIQIHLFYNKIIFFKNKNYIKIYGFL